MFSAQQETQATNARNTKIGMTKGHDAENQPYRGRDPIRSFRLRAPPPLHAEYNGAETHGHVERDREYLLTCVIPRTALEPNPSHHELDHERQDSEDKRRHRGQIRRFAWSR
jgi:hypothetical protein